ncbi:MAG TPA: hypothetical protein VEN78_41495, partial [Bradyrhizobium sp.]|nr:hypothetical protein [Bradyrhizobium sp.]
LEQFLFASELRLHPRILGKVRIPGRYTFRAVRDVFTVSRFLFLAGRKGFESVPCRVFQALLKAEWLMRLTRHVD